MGLVLVLDEPSLPLVQIEYEPFGSRESLSIYLTNAFSVRHWLSTGLVRAPLNVILAGIVCSSPLVCVVSAEL